MRPLLFAFLLMLPALSPAQEIPPTRPSVRGIFPHGAQQGTAPEIAIRGQNLQGTTEIRFERPKLRAEILSVEHNLIKARVRIDAGAEPGRYDLRIIAPHGSTVDWFNVSARAETFEKEPNNDTVRAQAIQFPVLINGIVAAGDYDYYKFTARAGQTLTFDVSANRYESGLDSVLGLLDENGAEIAYSDDYYWFKDPHLVHRFEKPGIYYLRIFGTSESGSETADYRLVAGEMPHVYHAMPMGVQRGKTTEIRLSGINLGSIGDVILGDGLAKGEVVSRGDRTATVRLAIPSDTPTGLHLLHVGDATLPIPFAISDLSEVAVTTELADSKQDPYPVTLPVAASGVIDRSHAAHHFAFRVDEPQTVLLAVESLRFDTHLDPIVLLYDESGKRIAYQDDPTTNSAKRPANVDPHLVFRLPKAGRYTVAVRDNAYRGDPNYPYRLVLKKAEPDFLAGVIGTDDTMFRGREHAVMIYVRRLEGWNVPVEVWAENLPAGVTGPAKVIVPTEPTRFKGTCAEENILDGTEVEFPLKVAPDAPIGLNRIRFRARGVIDGRTVEHEVLPRYWWRSTQKIWGPGESRDWYATVADLPALILTTGDRISAPRGEQRNIQVVVTRLDGGTDPLEVRGVNLPAGVAIEPVTVRPGGTLADVKVRLSADKPVSVVLEGVAAGKVLGKSHPIVIDPAARAAGGRGTPDED